MRLVRHLPGRVRCALLSVTCILSMQGVADLCAIRAMPQQSSAQGDNKDLVRLFVTVTDKSGNYVMGLSEKDFAVYDGKTAQSITCCSVKDEPISIGILYDVSGSTYDAREGSRNISEALSRFVRLSNKANEYSLITISKRPEVLVARTRNGDEILAAVEQLASLEPKGHTALYDACYLGAEQVMSSRYQKRAIILITDGYDNLSKYDKGKLRRYLKERNLLVYAVNIVGEDVSPPPMTEDGRRVLDELTSVTGGRVFYPTKAYDKGAIFEHIATELRHQYSLGVKLKSFDGEWHSLKVKVNSGTDRPEFRRLTVRSREGYYALDSAR